MRGEHSHVCSNKELYSRTEGVGVAEAARPGNQFIAMQRRRHVTIVLSLQKVAGYYRQSCPPHTQPALGLNAFIVPIYSYKVRVSFTPAAYGDSMTGWVILNGSPHRAER